MKVYPKKPIAISLLLSSLMLLNSCGNGNKEDINLNDTTQVKKAVTISSEVIHEVIKSIPPPVEITSLIKESGVPFQADLLNPTDNKNKYTSTYQKALNLGIYGADLGYINLYEKTYQSLKYLDAVRDLANDLSVGQFFDFETIKRLASNNKNIDSIIYISTTSFEKMNDYLAKQKRDNISTLMLIGGWIESMHLATNIGKNEKNQELIKRVGEQKVALDQISILINAFKGNAEFDHLINDINELKSIYDQIKISYEYHEPATKEVNGMLVVEDNSTSKVEINEEQFFKIADKIAELRSKFINV
jgi:hypothetical protein